MSPDGTRLVTSVATVAPEGKKFLSALWELDPGSLLFTSARPDPETTDDDKDDDPPAALWL
ncbi:MAG: hypothetical protein ACRDKW_00630, partial [Actinomycetota bacterium]